MAKLDVDIDLIGRLADLMDEKGLTELVIEKGDTKLRFGRGGSVPVCAPVPSTAPVAAAAPGTHPASANATAPAGAVESPMVGSVYLAPQPGAANFVSVGTKVTEGDTLLIIEAMKVMNQIPAPKSGTVTQVLVVDGQPVEFGEPLVVIE